MILMKPLYALLLSAALACSLTACTASGGGTASSDAGGASEQPSSSAAAESSEEASSETASEPESSETSALESEETAEIADPETGGTLIAYFSWSGNTEQMAELIQAETGGDLFEIEPAAPYTDDYDALLDIAQQEQDDNARPELASAVENWDSYDVVFVGYPDWWSDAPMIVYSFLESYDWEGKTLVPFCTSGGSGFGRSLDKLPDSAPGAAILEGLHISGSRVDSAAEEVAAWIDGLALS